MIVKRSGGRIIGAELNAREKKALDMELNRQIEAFDRRNQINVEACILWALHKLCGFGKLRLSWFYRNFRKYYQGLLDYYGMEEDGSAPYLALAGLREMGIDLAAWHDAEGWKEEDDGEDS